MRRLLVFSLGAVVAAAALLGGPVLEAQLQQSGGPGSTVTANQGGAPWSQNVTQLGGTAVDTNSGTKSAGTLRVVLATDQPNVTTPLNMSLAALPALAGGTANIGLVRAVPSSCTQSTNFANATAQVATGAGTTVTSTTTCVTFAYANNITNSAVTLRLADKAGTPVIWLGGNADFSVPANSNMRIPIDGVTFTSGITAIAGTSSAINLQINGLQ